MKDCFKIKKSKEISSEISNKCVHFDSKGPMLYCDNTDQIIALALHERIKCRVKHEKKQLDERVSGADERGTIQKVPIDVPVGNTYKSEASPVMQPTFSPVYDIKTMQHIKAVEQPMLEPLIDLSPTIYGSVPVGNTYKSEIVSPTDSGYNETERTKKGSGLSIPDEKELGKRKKEVTFFTKKGKTIDKYVTSDIPTQKMQKGGKIKRKGEYSS